MEGGGGGGRSLFATVSAPKKHLEAHRAEEVRRSCSDVSVEPHHGVSRSVKAVCDGQQEGVCACVCVRVSSVCGKVWPSQCVCSLSLAYISV